MGRKRKEGQRYENGRLKPVKREDLPAIKERAAPALAKRMVDKLIEECSDAKNGHELGRLLICGKITDAEYAVGYKYGEIVGRSDFYMGRRRSAKSPGYQAGYGQESEIDVHIGVDCRSSAEASLADPTLYEQRAMSAETAVREMQNILLDHWSWNDRFLLDRVCVENEPLTAKDLVILREMLETLIGYFGTKAAPKKEKKVQQAASVIRARAKPKAKRETLDDQVLRRFSKLSADYVLGCWRNLCTELDYEAFRHSRMNLVEAL
jgi:hypothetical protein